MRYLGPLALAGAALALMTACSVGPDYVRPSMVSPDAYKDSARLPSLVTAWPAALWEIFGDPQLNALEARVTSDQQTCVGGVQYRRGALVLGARRVFPP